MNTAIVTPPTKKQRRGADPRWTFDESAADVFDRVSPADRVHLEKVFSRIDLKRVEALRAKYAKEIEEKFPEEPSGSLKYLDLPYWLNHKVALALRLGLDKRAPMDILDLGTGAAHFLAVCQGFGHRCIGSDIEIPVYADIAECLDVTRVIERVDPLKPLQPRGLKFDLVSAIWISFNSIGSTKSGKRIYWSLDHWRYLVEDLKANHLKRPGAIHFELNTEYDCETNTDEFSKPLMDMFKGWGATVDERNGRMTLPV